MVLCCESQNAQGPVIGWPAGTFFRGNLTISVKYRKSISGMNPPHSQCYTWSNSLNLNPAKVPVSLNIVHVKSIIRFPA